MSRTFFERFGHIGVVVLPDTVLSDDTLIDPDTGAMLPDLRASYSQAGLVYARILRPCSDGLYWAEVFFHSPTGIQDTERIILTEEALSFALPWDIRLQGRSSAEILMAMQAHALAVRPAQRREPHPCCEPVDEPSPVTPAQPSQPPREETILIPLPELFVSTRSIEEARADMPQPPPDRLPAHPTAWARLVWLHAALAMVRRQLQHSRQMFAKLDVLLDMVLSAQKHMRQSLVSASPVQSGNRLVGWRLKIALPLVEVLA